MAANTQALRTLSKPSTRWQRQHAAVWWLRTRPLAWACNFLMRGRRRVCSEGQKDFYVLQLLFLANKNAGFVWPRATMLP